MHWRTLPVFLGLLLAACSGAPEGESAEDVVGGRPEAGYSAAGQVSKTPYGETKALPVCSAALIAPDAVLTAAHCIRAEDVEYRFDGVGEGAAATVVYVHPGFDGGGPCNGGLPCGMYDVAVVRLRKSLTIKPFKLADAVPAPGAALVYIGYGRTTAGSPTRRDGYTNARRSFDLLHEQTDWLGRIVARGVDGGNCYGDSGGPLIHKATGELLGALSYFATSGDPEAQGATRADVCRQGNRMGFTGVQLRPHRAFIERALKCAYIPPAPVAQSPVLRLSDDVACAAH